MVRPTEQVDASPIDVCVVDPSAYTGWSSVGGVTEVVAGRRVPEAEGVILKRCGDRALRCTCGRVTEKPIR